MLLFRSKKEDELLVFLKLYLSIYVLIVCIEAAQNLFCFFGKKKKKKKSKLVRAAVWFEKARGHETHHC